MKETKKIKKFLGSQKPKVFAKRKINFDRIALVIILTIISVGGVIAALNVKTEGNIEVTGDLNSSKFQSPVISINGTINITQTASGVILRNGLNNMTGNSSGWYWQ